jgi:hypothetical protein
LEAVKLTAFEESPSDHRPTAVQVSIRGRTSEARVPNRVAVVGYMNKLLANTNKEPSITELQKLVKE